jgi:hypothetical protein
MTSQPSAVQRTLPTPSPSSAPLSKPPPEPWISQQVSSYFIAGGIAGAASRTVVSPLERLKIIQCGSSMTSLFLGTDSCARRQVQPRNTGKQYTGVWRSLARMWNEEGFKGFMRGNGINCVRIIPYSAVQFTTYEQLKKVCCSESELQRLITFSAVVHIKWEETAGYPHPISQWCSCRHYFCLFVIFDMLRGLAIFSTIFCWQAQHTH